LVALRDEVFTITSRPPVCEFTCLHYLVFWDIGNQSRAWVSLEPLERVGLKRGCDICTCDQWKTNLS
jgi:hypothetical protein